MFKHRTRNLILDKLHKGFVITCIGVTGYGCYLLGWRFYRYFTVIKPERQILASEEQKQLLAEGRGFNETLDTATELKP